ncbi:TPA: bifunctional (p)ppGpp synthetase/guanosine-3',5'-bis(diphosphate) 3'-pyrophosphohydrolase [Candidatus Berkelbacteria bacterium]|uniref:(P)ppGpp synthetase SpoT/RelA, GTP pyrophosphokinase n=1 Tax=Berkelbacteria bacterium GW2011_GWE1_39_12 TaxID=1618337 RepID=A0A0G4B4P2_9BACT|nr:MAG: (p)ppGpp synthetase SpoT/RelA, GTP pyrophosphokinase [Berkelbacteria bacterium GW2011_GWE1_39_12]HBO60132.1 bifunctional (p)ppGpp synthetase/guanosine-3',5'-bis(diphosphate) 3'-pyrophosphohydrolase [Candidatus Berkelbacteria bacterium]
MGYDELANKIAYLSKPDQQLVRHAFLFAQKCHEGQVRNTGEPYVQHAIAAAGTIADLHLDAKTVAAALLHDTCEDTDLTLNDLRKEFGREIANLVDGVTKLSKIRITTKWLFVKEKEQLAEYDRQIETLRKMFVAMSSDIRVVILKLADRLHNMQTLDGVPKEKRYRIAKETLAIYAPLAYRLGMGEVKGKLEDLAFPYVYPEEYAALKKKAAGRLVEKERYILQFKKKILAKLYKDGIKGQIHGRTKHMYSLWRKLQRYDNDLSHIYDLVALRIIVNSVEECYKALGIIHNNWKPLVGRIKDYIAMPKPNGYRSIHTTVFGPGGEIVEIQIRSKEMHEQAEFGIAAHWHYSEKKGGIDYLLRKVSRAPKKELVWVNELAKWQKAVGDNKEMESDLGMDFFSDRIFVYTPTGDVKDLPIGATPIDFAYAVHTDLGNHVGGAKVNGKMVDLAHELKRGDIVDIIKKKNASPKRDWLEFAKTSLARGKIKSQIKGK